jgi:hypothetical protein
LLTQLMPKGDSSRGGRFVRIRPIGRFWLLDANGFIQNDAGPAKILPPYTGLVTEVRDAYLEHLRQRAHVLVPPHCQEHSVSTKKRSGSAGFERGEIPSLGERVF